MNILKYSEHVHMAETRKLVRPRHMNSFQIFYNIHSITYNYYDFVKLIRYLHFSLLKHTIYELAESHFRKGSPVLAACCHLAVDDTQVSKTGEGGTLVKLQNFQMAKNFAEFYLKFK